MAYSRLPGVSFQIPQITCQSQWTELYHIFWPIFEYFGHSARVDRKTDGQSSKQQRHFHPSGLRTLTLSSFFLSGWRQCKNSGRGQYLCLHTMYYTYYYNIFVKAKMCFKSKAFHNENVSEILNSSFHCKFSRILIDKH